MGFLTDLSPINKFLFFPPQPASYSLESFRGELCNLNGVLCLALSAVTPSSNVILYAHGNASDIGQCRRYLVRLRDRLGMHILAVEYPGYGVAGGAPSEATVDRALQAVFDYVTQALRWPKRCVLVMGRSIGTGPAVKLAAREPECAGLVLLAAFTSIKAVAEQMLGKAAMVMVDRWRSVDNIAQVRCPVLLIHGSADQTIPAQHSLELYQAVRHARRDIQIFENLDHNQYNWKTIIRRLEEFFQQFDVRDPSIPHRLLALPREVFEEWGDHGKGCAPPDMWSPFRAVFYGASAASAAGGGLAPKGQQVRHPIIAAQERGGSSGLGDVGAVGLVQQGGGGGGGAASGSTPSASPRPSFSSFASPPPGGAVSPFALQALTPQPDADYEKIMRGDTSVLGAAAAAAADEGRAPEPPPLFTLPRPPRRAGHPLSTGGTPPLSGGGGTPAAAAAGGGGLPPRHHHQRGAQSLDLTPITITSWLSPARRDNQRPPSRGKAVTSCSPQHRQRKEYWRRERTRSWNRVDRPEEYDETKHEEEEFDEEAVLESEHRFRSRVAEVLPLPPRRPPSRVRRPERPGSAARAAAAAAAAARPRGPGGGGPGGERRAHSSGPGGAGRRREMQGAREAALATHQRSQSAALSPRAQREALQGQRRIPALFRRRRRRRGSDASSTSGGGGGGREEARSPSWGRRGRRKADRSGSRGRAAVDVPAAGSRAPSPVPGYTPTAAELRLQAALAAAAAAPPPPPAASPSPHLLVATAAHTPQRPLREGGRGAAAGVGAGRGGGSLSPAPPPHQLTVPYSPVPFMGAPGVAT